jgi:ferric-dicitrate binding protein FerR (iron transport regulator)
VVKLTGEAFFEVAKDAKHPFKVKVEGQTVEVLGTSFNVRAYPNSSVIQTTLKTGRINLQTQNERLTLSPGEQTDLDKRTGELLLKKVNPSNFDSWKEGRYEFVNEDLIEVFKVVERLYDVELNYNEEDFKLMNFSGVIKRNNSIQHFLTLLGYSIPINYEINMEKVKISKAKEAKEMKNK